MSPSALGRALAVSSLVMLAWGPTRASAQPAGAGGTSTVSPASGSSKKLPPGHPSVGTPPSDARQNLPPGHPNVGTPQSDSRQNLPPGHPNVGAAQSDSQKNLPPGHPSVDAEEAPDDEQATSDAARENPHDQMDAEAPRDVVETDPEVPRGSVEATIADPEGAPISGIEVALVKSFQSVALGASTHSESVRTNEAGNVTFKKLSTDRSYSYEVVVRRGPAQYSSGPFALNRDAGQKVLLHVFPATRDINQARIAMRGLIYVQPLEDVFQCEVWFQVFNVGKLAWVPSNLGLELPLGAKAFTSHEEGEARFENPEGRRVTLHGTYAPGRQNDVRFSFQVPNEQTSTASFDFPLPPHVGEFRVIVESAPGMGLSARGFPPAQRSTGARDERILITQRRGMGLDMVHFQLSGLPTRGSAPWVAVFLAVGIAAGGLSTAFGKADPRHKRRRMRGDKKAAKNKILEELVALERAHQQERIGPRTYEETRRTLLRALARLLEPGTLN